MKAASAMACCAAACALFAAGCAQHAASVPPSNKPTPRPIPTTTDPLNGAIVPLASVKHRVAAVMIDNYPIDARPQSGLHDADIVYEVEAEGGITRYMALYLAGQPKKIGPVRSARTYFVDLARPYDPFFAHGGQNTDTIDKLKELRAGGFADYDEILQAQAAFWRDDTRDMPHNLYTSIERIRKTAPEYGTKDTAYAQQEFDFTASDPRAPGAPPSEVPPVLISFWNDYNVLFVYDGTGYQRYIDGAVQVDRDDARPYSVANIIAVWIPATVLDSIGDLAMNVYGAFPAVLIHDGRAETGTWVAPGPADVPSLFGADEKPLVLKPGQIYIEVLPQGSRIASGKSVWSH